MYNKLNENHKKKHIYDSEEEPPEKKLISDGDILIKQLAKKQQNTQLNLQEQLAAKSHFYKSTEEVSVTSYTSGSLSLEEFNSVLQHSNDVEKLKASGLTNEEVQLFFDLKNGLEYLKDRQKNVNESVLKNQLEEILNKIKQSKIEKASCSETKKSDRLKTELTLATKPTSIETKLLKFALENQQICGEKLPSAMDQIKEVEQQLVEDLSPPDIRKIRKKARQLAKQIDRIGSAPIEFSGNGCNSGKQTHFEGGASKWDIREIPKERISKETKTYTCKPQNLYTIRDGQIIKLNQTEVGKNNANDVKNKLSVEEIRKIPKFENYERGIPSKVLYLKNLANGVVDSDLEKMLPEFLENVISINVMQGRMRGQAFIEFTDEQVAERALDQCNGIVVKNRPIIIQFGKGKCS